MLLTTELWFLGSPAAEVPPLRTLQPHHLRDSKTLRKRLSALSLLIRELERLARLEDVWAVTPTPEEVFFP
jgi:hypothetical protein